MLSAVTRPGRSPIRTQTTSAPVTSETTSIAGTRPNLTKKGLGRVMD